MTPAGHEPKLGPRRQDGHYRATLAAEAMLDLEQQGDARSAIRTMLERVRIAAGEGGRGCVAGNAAGLPDLVVLALLGRGSLDRHGDSVTVIYPPSAPADARLWVSRGGLEFLPLIAGAALTLGGLRVVVLEFLKRRRRRQTSGSQAGPS